MNQQNAKIQSLIKRLIDCEPDSDQAAAIYEEAEDAGLRDQLSTALEQAAALYRSKADALRADWVMRNGPMSD